MSITSFLWLFCRADKRGDIVEGVDAAEVEEEEEEEKYRDPQLDVPGRLLLRLTAVEARAEEAGELPELHEEEALKNPVQMLPLPLLLLPEGSQRHAVTSSETTVL